MTPKRRRIKKLAKAQGWLCHWCGLRMNKLGEGRLSASLDHLVPRNGLPRPAVAAHKFCNNARGHLPEIPPNVLKEVAEACNRRDNHLVNETI